MNLMPKVIIPVVLQRLTDDKSEVRLPGRSVGQVIRNLENKFPGFKNKLLGPDGNVRGFIGVFVNNQDIRKREGVETPVSDEDEIALVPAVAGGA